jgi:Flp pilus assembly pilin Flp
MSITSMQERRVTVLQCKHKSKEGRVSIEYALLVALVALALADVYLSLGRHVSRIWSAVDTKLQMANTSERLQRTNSRKTTQLKSETSGSTPSTSSRMRKYS